MTAIYKAISEVQKALANRGISKDKRCQGGGNFAYRGIEDVYAALSPLLADAGLIITTNRIERLEDVTSGGQKPMRLVRIKVIFRLFAVEDGSFLDVESLGEGADMSDKASGKALSYAYKQMVFTNFAVPVEGQPDSDREAVVPETPFVSDSVRSAALAAASNGTEAYREFWKTLSKEDRNALRVSGEMDKHKKIAEDSDAINGNNGVQ